MFTDAEIVNARTSPLGYAMTIGRGKFVAPPHLVLLNEALVNAVYGPRKRLAVFMPPRHSKSTTISRAGVGWYLGNNPDHNACVASYEQDFASSWGRLVRQDFAQHGQELFGLRVSGDSAAVDRWSIAGHTGGMRCAGIGGGLTGMGFNFASIDDPIKDAKQAHSKSWRDGCVSWFHSVVETRLEPDAVVVLVLTRWHEDDLAGRLLKEQPGEWDVLSLPALAEGNDPLGRADGEALWPKRFPDWWMKAKKKAIGSYWFNAMFQQRPSPEAGNKIRRDWFRFYREAPKGFDRVFTSTDCSFKDTAGTSYVVIQAWGIRGADAFLLDQIRARMDFPETLAAFVQFHRKWKQAGAKLVEDKANGPAIIASLKKSMGGILPIEVSGKGSKVARLSVVTPYFESGNIHVPDITVYSWVADYIEELVGFPNAANDDQVDATSQALSYAFGGVGVSVSGPETKTAASERGSARKRERESGPEPLGGGSVERLPVW